ncbi:Poly-beta-hydroxybutyrate polymerase domain-containing protein [Cupriavidus necator]|uniref:Poly-beta-hydroxybutyrate polymerase domain-containing protein n=1 Tax=Cupriavidus necator TaxID=106590 RepID=A0A1K0IB84_CUPNE|nr:Poly-beta-hydroxybutyrate polymerase domain-containing protein [Cupriavidus necator]
MTKTKTQPSDVFSNTGLAWSSSALHCANEPPVASLATPAERLDRLVRAAVAAATGGVSPATLWLAGLDWAVHLAVSPGKQYVLVLQSLRHMQDWLMGSPPALGAAGDPRFSDADWERWPFGWLRDTFLGTQSFWHEAITGLHGVSPHHENIVNFMARQCTDMLSPSNFWWLNPEVLSAAAETGGANFIAGGGQWLDDHRHILAGFAPGDSRRRCLPQRVGRDVATTPGQVVYRNALFELIQYAPQTSAVWREPVLIVPSWILKYYILDLSPHNSLVRYLVAQGHTVFMISWRNPGKEGRDLGLDDYLERGLFEAIEQVRGIAGNAPIHAAGYCLGGTLLAIGAEVLARDGGPKAAGLKTATLFAAQTDFSEPGEMGLFIDASELAYLEALMWEQGYLDGRQLANAFQLLHSRDLMWSRLASEYLLGQRAQATDLMAWNADTTRLPYRLHSETLEYLYLHNRLAEGKYWVHGRPVALADLRLPMFVVGTERDHVSPWPSVYKLHLLTRAEISFLLSSGGHNAGIVSEPGHEGRHYRFSTRSEGSSYLSPGEWFAQTPVSDGSWWPCWQLWLAAHSSETIAPPVVEMHLGEAPGSYVLEP